MNNEQIKIQAKLEKWAEDTVKAYHQIATRDDVNIAYSLIVYNHCSDEIQKKMRENIA